MWPTISHVLALVAAADVVDLAGAALAQHQSRSRRSGPRPRASREPACRRRTSAAARPSSAFVVISGISFSGYWFGPYVFEPRVIEALTPNVRAYAGHVQVAGRLGDAVRARRLERVGPRRTSRRRRGRRRPRPSRPGRSGRRLRRTSSSSTCVPKNSVRPKSVAPRIERSTCVSAAKLTIASQPAAASATASASQMSADDELDPGALEVRRVARSTSACRARERRRPQLGAAWRSGSR